MSKLGGFFRGMFGGGAQEPPPSSGAALLRAYGKLPFYPEYRRLEITPGAPTAFSQWMDAGRLAWFRSPTKTEQGVTRASRLLLRLPDSRELIVANVWDSRDSAGRVFPFSFFVCCPPEALGSDPVEQWVAARSIHREFDQAHAALAGFSAGGDFYKLFSKRYVTPRPPDLLEQIGALRQQAAAIPAIDWFHAWAPDSKVDPAVWYATMQRRVDEWRTQADALRSLAVSCPIASGYSYPAQAVCWLTLLGTLASRGGRSLSFIGPGTETPEGAALHVLLRDVKPDDFQLMCSDAGRYGFIDNLASVPASAAAAAAGTNGAPPPPEPPAGSLIDWMLHQSTRSNT